MVGTNTDDPAAFHLRSLKLTVDQTSVRSWMERLSASPDGLEVCDSLRAGLPIGDAALETLAFDVAFNNFVKMAEIVGDPSKHAAIATTVANDVMRKYRDFLEKPARDPNPPTPREETAHPVSPPVLAPAPTPAPANEPSMVRAVFEVVTNTVLALVIVACGFALGLRV